MSDADASSNGLRAEGYAQKIAGFIHPCTVKLAAPRRLPTQALTKVALSRQAALRFKRWRGATLPRLVFYRLTPSGALAT